MGQTPCLGPPFANAFSSKWGFYGGPVTDKQSSHGWSDSLRLIWGVSCMQGWREKMEDAHIAIPHLHGWPDTAVFGVMDGHGGEQVARFCEQRLPEEIARHSSDDVPGALASAFHKMDELLADPRSLQELRALTQQHSGLKASEASLMIPQFTGCTAVVCCIRKDTITVANAGDCRAVLCRTGRAIDMSEDHKPQLPSECARICRAGGCIMEQRCLAGALYRVNGDLSLSRAIGDLRYKQNSSLTPQNQIICCTPDIRIFTREPEDEFLLLACDGVWDVLSSQQAVDFVRPFISGMLDGTLRPSAVAEELLDICISPDLTRTHGLGGDNMTLMIIAFRKGITEPRSIFTSASRTMGPRARSAHIGSDSRCRGVPFPQSVISPGSWSNHARL